MKRNWFKDNLWPSWFWNSYYGKLDQAYEYGYMDGVGQKGQMYVSLIAERSTKHHIRTKIEARVAELQECQKNDNCQEFASLIESYIDEWLD